MENWISDLEDQGVETAHTTGEKYKDIESPTVLSCLSLECMPVLPTFAYILKIPEKFPKMVSLDSLNACLFLTPGNIQSCM